MRWYQAAIPMMVLMISACASNDGGKRAQDGSVTTASPTAATDGVAPATEVESGKSDSTQRATTSKPVAPSKRPIGNDTARKAAVPVAYQKGRTSVALLGAVGGGLTSGAVKTYMTSQRLDLQKALQDEIRSGYAAVDKLPRNVIRIRVHARAAFDNNSSSVNPAFCSTMDKLANVLVRYEKTTLTVVGPPDAKGTVEHNRKLSQQRALAVAQYFESREVNPMRLATLGKGPAELPTDGDPSRMGSRRVEIVLEPVMAK